MRTTVVLAVILSTSGVASAGPIDAIARVARTLAREPLSLSFQPEPCTLTAGDATIPLRTVSWSMTKVTDGTSDALVTARCAGGAVCVVSGPGGNAAAPRFSLRLAASAREARTMLRDLKGLTAHCR